MTELRAMAKKSALTYSLLEQAEKKDEKAIQLAAKELRMIVSCIDYKLSKKVNKKFGYNK